MGKFGLAPRYWPSDWFDDGWPFGEPQSWTYRGMWVDLDKYDVTLKEAHKGKLAKEKDKELEELEKFYEQKKQRLLSEKKELTS
jgi:hypothetical protein